MPILRFSVWEQSTQRYDADFDESDYQDYLHYLHRNAQADTPFNPDFAKNACKVFDTLTFQDVVDIIMGEKEDITFPSGWGNHETSVDECIRDYVNDYIYNNEPDYLDSEIIDSDIQLVEPADI